MTNSAHCSLYLVLYIFAISLSSLGDEYKWTGIGDMGAIVLTDRRVFMNFKTLK